MNRGIPPRRGRAPQPRVAQPLRATLGTLKSSLHGHENKLRGTNPPSVNQIPFNTIVVAEEIPGNGSFTDIQIDDICDKLKAQIYLEQQGVLVRVKVQRIDFWCVPAASTFGSGGDPTTIGINPSLQARFYSLVQTVAETSAPDAIKYPVLIKEIDDEGLSGQTAAVASYTFPRAMADIPMKRAPAGQSVVSQKLIASVASPVGTTVKARFHLHWNTVQPESTIVRRSLAEAKSDKK